MNASLCYTRVGDIPWLTQVANRADAYLSGLPREELSGWYIDLALMEGDSA